MKRTLILSLAAGLAVTAASLHAGPLDRAQVAADAKWLLHVDIDALRKTQLGTSLMKTVVAEAGEDLKEDANIDLPALVKSTSSIMAYGTDYKSGKDGKGVLIWQGSKEIEQIASAFLVQQAEATKAGSGNVKLAREGAQPVYAFGDDMHIVVRPGGGLILGRSVDQIDLATKVLEGKAASLKDKPTFTEYATLPGGFFFMALAEGFNKDAEVPPQANVLKLADGGRLAVGESDGKLRVQLTLDAKNKDVTQQIQQVVQGLLAIATLSLGDEPDLQALIRDTKVNTDEKRVSLELAIPVATALKHLNDEAEPTAKTEPKSNAPKQAKP